MSRHLLIELFEFDSPPNGYAEEDDLFIKLHRFSFITLFPLVAALMQKTMHSKTVRLHAFSVEMLIFTCAAGTSLKRTSES